MNLPAWSVRTIMQNERERCLPSYGDHAILSIHHMGPSTSDSSLMVLLSSDFHVSYLRFRMFLPESLALSVPEGIA